MSQFAHIWAGGGEPNLRPGTKLVAAEPSAGATRLRAFGDGLVAKLPAPPTQLAINQAKLRLSNRLSAELAFVGTPAERLALFEAFAEILQTLSERELDVVPPELVEHVFVRDPSPTAVSARQAVGFFLDTDEA